MDGIKAQGADLFVTGDIGFDFRAEDFIQQLNLLKDGDVTVHIFSPGGSVFDALAVYDFIKGQGIDISVRISGLAGSAATVIASASNDVSIGQNSFYFVHNAFIPGGASSEHDQDVVDNINERLVDIYKSKTGMDKRAVRKLLAEGDEGRFLTAEEAKQLGFADRVTIEAKVAANIEDYKSKYLNTMTDNDKSWLEGVINKALGRKDEEKSEDVKVEDTPEFQAAVEAAVTTVAEKLQADTASEIESVKADAEAVKTALAEKDEEIKALNAKLAKEETKATEVEGNEETPVEGKKKEEPKNLGSDVAQFLVAKAKSKFS